MKAISVDYMMLISELTHLKGVNRNIITNSQIMKTFWSNYGQLRSNYDREWNKPD